MHRFIKHFSSSRVFTRTNFTRIGFIKFFITPIIPFFKGDLVVAVLCKIFIYQKGANFCKEHTLYMLALKFLRLQKRLYP